ncbi:hypothetical protein Taro_003761 [Colocasia esculenta]|uniref:Uncharacterized protein n=1 Tax=Colocasia esculenta TaxID=4460 RepID=A0A843TGD8_COLES|nr:hypothetical protein [Colocasia esculenta]
MLAITPPSRTLRVHLHSFDVDDESAATSMDANSELAAYDVDVNLPNLFHLQIRKRPRNLRPLLWVWLYVVGMVFLLVRVSRGETSHGVRIRGLVQAMQTQAHTQAALQAQLEAQQAQARSEPTCGGPRCYIPGSRMVLWRLVGTTFDHRTLDEALSAACRQEGEMEQYLEEKKASQKRPAAPFQRQEKTKAAFQSPQRPVASGSSQVSSQCFPSSKKECSHYGRAHGGTECWKLAGKCLKCGSSEHKIKDFPRLQQGVQRGAAPAAAAAAVPATG